MMEEGLDLLVTVDHDLTRDTLLVSFHGKSRYSITVSPDVSADVLFSLRDVMANAVVEVIEAVNTREAGDKVT